MNNWLAKIKKNLYSPKKISKRDSLKYVIGASILFGFAHPLFFDNRQLSNVAQYLRQEQRLTVFPDQLQLTENLYETDHPFQISRTNNLIYVHVPKTGGTTFENSILFDDARNHHMVGGHHPISKMLDNAHKRGIHEKNFLKVAHVRHPCERFISAFYYLKSGGMNAGDAKKAHDYNIDSLSMEEFVSTITDRAWFNRAPVHFIPQVDYLFYKTNTGVFGGRPYAMDRPHGTFGLDMILCQDDWMEGLNRLNQQMVIMNGNHQEQQQPQQRYLPKDLYTSKHNFSTKQEKMTCKDLNIETRAMIEQIYAMDYCVFGYKTLLSKDDICVGSYMTPEQFTEKFKECEERINGDIMLKPWL